MFGRRRTYRGDIFVDELRQERDRGPVCDCPFTKSATVKKSAKWYEIAKRTIIILTMAALILSRVCFEQNPLGMSSESPTQLQSFISWKKRPFWRIKMSQSMAMAPNKPLTILHIIYEYYSLFEQELKNKANFVC